MQEEESEEEEERTQSTQRNRRRAPQSDEEDEEEQDEDDEAGEDEIDVDARPDAQDQTVKKMVRYALACEYQRMPIRRTGITEKGVES